jgi:hypothetical protein
MMANGNGWEWEEILQKGEENNTHPLPFPW